MIYLLKVSVCSILFYLLFYLVYRRQNNHKWNRFYLLSALLLSFAIPLIQLPVFAEYISVPTQSGLVPSSSTPTVEAVSFWNLKNSILVIYFLGVVITLGIMSKALLSVFSQIKNGRAEKNNGYTKVICANNIALSSFLNFLFIPFSKADSITEYEMTHELVHIRQKHSWDILFVEIVKVFLWFNPIILLYKKSMVEVHEYLADAHAIAEHGKSEYQAFLLQQVSRQPQSSLVHNFYSLFKRRIQMINNSKQSSHSKYFLIIPVLLVAMSFFSFSTYEVRISDAAAIDSVVNDTIPSHDTMVIFDPWTGKEKVQIVPKLKIAGKEYKYKRDPIVVVDTVIVFDPETKTESISIVRMEKKHELDTITTFDADTYKETTVIIDPNTGIVDTLKKM